MIITHSVMYIAIIINQETRRVWVAIDFDLLVRGYWLGPLWQNRFIIKSKTPSRRACSAVAWLRWWELTGRGSNSGFTPLALCKQNYFLFRFWILARQNYDVFVVYKACVALVILRRTLEIYRLYFTDVSVL